MSISLFGRKVVTAKRKLDDEDSSVEEIQPVIKKARSSETSTEAIPEQEKQIISTPPPSKSTSVAESIWKGRLQGKEKEIVELKKNIVDLEQENLRIASESQKKIQVSLY
mgnify:CR=1 FL=1